jgi:D-lyxose ketol-isomerase
MITVKIQDIVNAIETFNVMSNKEMPIKTSFKVARIAKELDKEYQLFNETRRKAIETYGEKDENGELKIDDKGNVALIPDKIETFSAEMNELLNNEVSLNTEPFTLSELEGITLTPAQTSTLLPFVEE